MSSAVVYRAASGEGKARLQAALLDQFPVHVFYFVDDICAGSPGFHPLLEVLTCLSKEVA